MEKPRILVLYYTQTGQLTRIINSVLSGVREELQVYYHHLEPNGRWRFPWIDDRFFDAMPESVLMTPAPIEDVPDGIIHRDYDMVMLAWQPWFLHPSQPIMALLQSKAMSVMRGKPVVTLCGCRNMWLNAGEVVKGAIRQAGGRHVGNIVLADRRPNLLSLLSIIRWQLKGKQEASRWLPAAGVMEKDIQDAAAFGKPLLEAAHAFAAARYDAPTVMQGSANAYAGIQAFNVYSNEEALKDVVTEKDFALLLPEGVNALQEKLLALNAVRLNSGLILLEQRGIKNFRYWAKRIREKGGPGDVRRTGRILQFKRLLMLGIFVLSPITGLIAAVKRLLQWRKLKGDVAYFKSTAYEPGRI